MSLVGGLWRRLGAGTGLQELRDVEERLDVVAEAVAENTALEVPLRAVVDDLEQALVEPLEHRLRLLGAEPPGVPPGVAQDIPPPATGR